MTAPRRDRSDSLTSSRNSRWGDTRPFCQSPTGLGRVAGSHHVIDSGDSDGVQPRHVLDVHAAELAQPERLPGAGNQSLPDAAREPRQGSVSREPVVQCQTPHSGFGVSRGKRLRVLLNVLLGRRVQLGPVLIGQVPDERPDLLDQSVDHMRLLATLPQELPKPILVHCVLTHMASSGTQIARLPWSPSLDRNRHARLYANADLPESMASCHF